MKCSCVYCTTPQKSQTQLSYPLILRLQVRLSDGRVIGHLATVSEPTGGGVVRAKLVHETSEEDRHRSVDLPLAALTARVLQSYAVKPSVSVDWTVNFCCSQTSSCVSVRFNEINWKKVQTCRGPSDCRRLYGRCLEEPTIASSSSGVGLKLSKKRVREEKKPVPRHLAVSEEKKVKQEKPCDDDDDGFDGVYWDDYNPGFSLEDPFWTRNAMENYLMNHSADQTLPRLVSIDTYFPCRFPRGNPSLEVVFEHPTTTDPIRLELGSTLLYAIPVYRPYVLEALKVGDATGGILKLDMIIPRLP